MKAVVIRKFGPPGVMNIEEIAVPPIADNEVLVRIHCSSVNPVDWKIRNGSLRFISGSRFPMTLGFDVSGVVFETGSSVRRFKRGDRVFGMLDFKHRGSYAEYARAREDSLAPIPDNVGFEEAGVVPLAALTAYQALHYKGDMRTGHSVLINGASGGVGSYAVQIAKAAGTHVTATCGPDNLEAVKDLGADAVIDYRKQDFTQSPIRYDIIFDAVGKLSFFRVNRNLSDAGRYITTLPDKPANILSFVLTPLLSVFGCRKRCRFISVRPSAADLSDLSLMMSQHKLTPLIGRSFTLNQIREAHAYSETGHARGKVLIRIG